MAKFWWLAGLLLVGCGENLIPNTEVEDTEQNREVIEFCERYRIALEAVDIPQLVTMASEDYYEQGDPTVGTDDYDYSGLERVLTERFERVETIRYDILYRRINYLADRIEVLYTFHGRYQIAPAPDLEAAEPVWFSKVGDNRLELARLPGGGFAVLGGM